VSRRDRAASLLLGAAAAALVLLNTAALLRDADLGELGAYRRLWADLARGIGDYVAAAHPIAPGKEARFPVVPNPIVHTRSVVVEKVAQLGIRPGQFWRTIRDEPFVRERLPAATPDPYDDPGRGILYGAALRMRGGIAPFLILWLAPLLLAPVVAWTVVEACRAGATAAGATFALLVGLSPFVLETASFARSSAGFYVVALLVLVPLAFHGLAGPAPAPRGLAARWLAAGVVFGVCTLCRSGGVLLLPGFTLILVAAAARLAIVPLPRRAAVAAVCLALFLTPWLVLKQPQKHDVWPAVWEGLGDFDRTKGHTWSDPVADELVRRGGATGFRTPLGMDLLKADALRHIREDPGWYAGILARRAFATVTQHRLWPTVRADGLWMRTSTSPNEGFMDKYYGYTTTVDWLGFGNDLQVEVPIGLMVLPALALFVWAARDPALRPRALMVLAVMAAALPLPVAISTAGAVEPQAFALAYGLGAALLLDALIARRRSRGIR
jgi:hypothetical protein